jgi:FkbM family methyltransferase
MSYDSFQPFFNADAYALNAARLQHLATLNLDLQGKTVLEVGAGVGLLTSFFAERGCTVLSTDARPENVAEIRREYPTRHAQVLDLDVPTDITYLGSFDIIFCYGLLYHLKDPEAALKQLASVCSGMILLETCVSPGDELAIHSIAEDQNQTNQAFSGMGCRPTRPWVMKTLETEFGFAYVSKLQPYHVDFDLDWQKPVHKPLHRSIFIGSRSILTNEQLLTVPPTQQHYEPLSQRVWIDLGEQPSQTFVHQARSDQYLQVYRLSSFPVEASLKLPNYRLVNTSSTHSLITKLTDLLSHYPIGAIDYLRLDISAFTDENLPVVIDLISDRGSAIAQLELTIRTTQIDLEKLRFILAQKGLLLIGKTTLPSDLQQWKLSRKEVTPFLPNIEALINTLEPPEVLSLAQACTVTQPIEPYPSWFYNIEWHSENPRVRVRRAIWSYFKDRSLQGQIVWNWVTGLKLNVLLTNDLSGQVFISGCYEPNEFYFLSKALSPGMTVLDVGANEGIYTVFMAHRVGETGRVIAFEPSDREFDRLQANVSLNHFQTVQLLKLGLGDRAEERTLKIAIGEHAGQNTLGNFVYPGVTEATTQTISLKPLDDVIREQAIDAIDLIKVDVEGAELAFLKGAESTLKTHFPLISIELLEDALVAQQTSSIQILRFLKSLGYEIFSISPFTGLPIKTKRETGLSHNIIAAHPARSWPLLTDAEQALQTTAALEKANEQFAQLNTEFAQLNAAFHQVNTAFRQGDAALNHYQQSLQHKQAELEENQRLVDVFKNRVEAMESSKFWQIRQAWSRLKKALGMKNAD